MLEDVELTFINNLNPNICHAKYKHKDAVWCEIKTIHRDTMIIGYIYLSPNSTQDDNMNLNTM